MQSYIEAFRTVCTVPESSSDYPRLLLSHDFSALDDHLLGIAVVSDCRPTDTAGDHLDQHNTLIHFLHKGNQRQWEDSLEACVGDGERVSANCTPVAQLGDAPVNALRMHCGFDGHGLEKSVKSKIRQMADALESKGLLKQTTKEAIFREFKITPRQNTNTDNTHARY